MIKMTPITSSPIATSSAKIGTTIYIKTIEDIKIISTAPVTLSGGKINLPPGTSVINTNTGKVVTYGGGMIIWLIYLMKALR